VRFEGVSIPSGSGADAGAGRREERPRISYVFGVGCGDDLDRAIDVLLSAAADHDGILADREPTVRVTDLGPTVRLTGADRHRRRSK